MIKALHPPLDILCTTLPKSSFEKKFIKTAAPQEKGKRRQRKINRKTHVCTNTNLFFS
jgi:hypothetical protein